MTWRWYRSLIFWAGLLVLGGIAWAWRDSCQMRSSLTWKEWYVGSEESGLTFGWSDVMNSPGLERKRYRSPARYPALSLSPPFTDRGRGLRPLDDEQFQQTIQDAPDRRTYYLELRAMSAAATVWLYVPYWLMIVAVAGVWIVLLGWRWRRSMRAGG